MATYVKSHVCGYRLPFGTLQVEIVTPKKGKSVTRLG